MNDSFSLWRGNDKSASSLRRNRRSSLIPDTDEDSNASITNEDSSKPVIDDSSSDNEISDFENSRAEENSRRSKHRSFEDDDDQTDSTDYKILPARVAANLNDTGSSIDSTIGPKPKTKTKKNIISDDSDEETETPRSKKQAEQSWTDADDASDTDSVSQSTDHSYVEEIPSESEAKDDPKSRFNGHDKVAVIPTDVQAEFVKRSEDQDVSYLTISDQSDAEDTSDRLDPSPKAELAAERSAGSSSASVFNSEDEALVMPFVKKEIGVGNVDPFVEQKRAMLTCNIQQVKSQLAKSKMLLNTANISLLPDKGEKLRRSINLHEAELKKLSIQLESLPKLATPKPKSKTFDSVDPIVPPPWETLPSPIAAKPLGKKALATQEREQALTEDRLKDLHGSLNARPGEDERAQDPKGLKVCLMPHQQHALAWLLWREKQKPHGGILADDMGLGKTLTMISLILTTLANEDLEEDSDERDSDDEWLHRNKSIRPKGGTLVVCPASVLSQWDVEINRRVKRGLLSVELFHGNHRESVARRLAKNDVVITTFNLLSREYNRVGTDSILHKINWRRVILDEAHIVRNHKSQASESVCNLYARSRWALTGTPIQNKELDLYALLKFLKCTPFDDIRVWKRWVDKNSNGHERLATVMKTLMLRRTKQELQAKGGLGALPDKSLEEIDVKLDPEEQLVYEKVLVFSRTLFAQFLHQRAEKHHTFELHAGKFDAPTFLKAPKDTQFTKAQDQLLARHAGNIKAHEILVLLLRLRQICVHPALIHAMLDREDLKGNDVVDEGGASVDVADGLGALSLEDNENIDPNEIGVDRRVVQNLLTTDNPVFNPARQSSKMRAVLATIQTILDKGDKIVVVSQWSSMLEVVRSHLDSLNGASYAILSGAVAVKNRQQIVESFNKVGSAPQILLLSLTAGGVGLNLVGGNHLLLLDIHWNPQLEAQAQDRIYRVGQTKSVYIYKFICLDTIEQRIKALQEKKLSLAQDVLTGGGKPGGSKLTLDDLKSLFSL